MHHNKSLREKAQLSKDQIRETQRTHKGHKKSAVSIEGADRSNYNMYEIGRIELFAHNEISMLHAKGIIGDNENHTDSHHKFNP